MKDNTFNREEKLFRSLEKTVRHCVKNISSCLQHIQVGATPLSFSMFLYKKVLMSLVLIRSRCDCSFIYMMTPIGPNLGGSKVLVKEANTKTWILLSVPFLLHPSPNLSHHTVGQAWFTCLPHGAGPLA